MYRYMTQAPSRCSDRDSMSCALKADTRQVPLFHQPVKPATPIPAIPASRPPPPPHTHLHLEQGLAGVLAGPSEGSQQEAQQNQAEYNLSSPTTPQVQRSICIHMYMYMYKYIYGYMYIRIYVYTDICIHGYMHTYMVA